MIRQLLNGIGLFLASLVLVSCAGRQPDVLDLPTEEVDLLVLGGSVSGVTTAGTVSDFDSDIKVLLVDPDRAFIIEPYLNLFLVDKMDAGLVFNDFETIAEAKGFSFVKEHVISVEAEAKRVILNHRIVHYKTLIDARYHQEGIDVNGTVQPDVKKLYAIHSAINKDGCKRIRIDATKSSIVVGDRALELYYLLKRKQGEKKGGGVSISLNPEHPRANDFPEEEAEKDFVITFLPDPKNSGLEFGSNFFMQYNHGLEEAGRVLREDFNETFLPGMVNEDRVMLHDYLNLEGVDMENGQKVNGAEYLSKVLRIKREIVGGRE